MIRLQFMWRIKFQADRILRQDFRISANNTRDWHREKMFVQDSCDANWNSLKDSLTRRSTSLQNWDREEKTRGKNRRHKPAMTKSMSKRAFRYTRARIIYIYVHYIWIIYIHKCERMPARAMLLEILMIVDVGRRSSECIGWNRSAADSVFNSNSTFQPWSYAQINKWEMGFLTLFFCCAACIAEARDIQLRKGLKKRDCPGLETIDPFWRLEFSQLRYQGIEIFPFHTDCLANAKLIFP